MNRGSTVVRDAGGRAGEPRGRIALLGAAATAVIAIYAGWLATGGAGLICGDEAYWLLQGRDAFRRLPAVAGSLVPLTDIVSGAWSALAAPLGLFGARLGWVLVNAGAGLLVFLALARVVPPARAAFAVVAAAPMICSQQFTVLEYTNVPWALLLLFALPFVQSQRSDLSAARAAAWGAIAGVFLGAAILSRLLMLPVVALPIAAWLLTAGRGRRHAVGICCGAAALTLAGGAWWLWRAGALAGIAGVVQATRNLGAAAGDFYSTWRLASTYIQNTVVGLEQFAVGALWLVVFLLYTRAVGEKCPRGARWLDLAPLVAAAGAAILAPVAAPGVFGPRFQSGFPCLVAGFCGLQLWRYCRMPATSRCIEVRLLLLFGIAIPLGVMTGSSLGFYRMISASWLAAPLAIALIPEAAAAVGSSLGHLVPAWEREATRASRAFLHGVVAVLILYSTTFELVEGFACEPRFAMTSSLRHPSLEHIRELPDVAADFDDMLAALQDRVRRGDVIFAYPHLEIVYWLTDTVSPLQFMFVHSSEAAIREALERHKPRCVVVQDNSRDPLWQYSDSRRAAVADFLAAERYRATWTNRRFTIHERPE